MPRLFIVQVPLPGQLFCESSSLAHQVSTGQFPRAVPAPQGVNWFPVVAPLAHDGGNGQEADRFVEVAVGLQDELVIVDGGTQVNYVPFCDRTSPGDEQPTHGKKKISPAGVWQAPPQALT